MRFRNTRTLKMAGVEADVKTKIDAMKPEELSGYILMEVSCK